MNQGARLAAALLVIALSLLIGCEPSGPAAGANQIVIRRGNGGDPQTLDPARAEDVHAFNVLTDLYEGLLALDESGNVIPGVAQSWEVSSDGLKYTFQLDTGARWSDGTPVTAAHFVAGMRRTLLPDTRSSYGFLLHAIRNAERVASGELAPSSLGVTATDDKTLIIELHERAPYLPSVLTMPVSYPFIDGAGQFVGNGPFVLAEWRPGSRMTLRKNQAFREADKVLADEIQYFPITEPVTELNLFRAGELDITATVPGSHVAGLRETHATELKIAPSLAVYYLAFDLTEPPLDNALLRRALSMAIDREALVRVTGRGERPAYGLVPDGVSGYAPARYSWMPLPEDARLANARKLYEQAGYSAENPLRLTLLFDAGDIHETIALAVSDMWRTALGAVVQLDKREWKYFLATRDERADWQVMRFAWSGDYDHPSTFTDILHSGSTQNLAGYSSDEYDRRLAKAAAADDSAEQMQLYAEAEAIVLADDPIAPLYFYVSKHLVASTITGFRSNVLDRHPSRYLGKNDHIKSN